MWIVRLALRRPYTFVVMALAIILLFPVVLMRTPVDIFPDINIPVISLVWTYNGLQPQEMEQRITSNVERGVTTLVSDVEHIESQSLNGIAVIKVYFQPGANIQTALAQTAATSFARNSLQFRELLRRSLTVASSASSAWILTQVHSRPRAFLPLTS